MLTRNDVCLLNEQYITISKEEDNFIELHSDSTGYCWTIFYNQFEKSNKYTMVFCSKCGDIYRRIAWNNRGKHSIVWRCCTRVEHGPGRCDAETIPEEDLQMVTVILIDFIRGWVYNIVRVLCAERNNG